MRSGLELRPSVAVDGAGNLYIVDFGNHRVRKVSPAGIITTIGGNGTGGFSDGGPAADAQLWPLGVAVDSAGNLYIADQGNSRVRKASTAGTITTVAGNGIFGYTGDGGPATDAQLSQPWGVSVDSAGHIFIADQLNNVIRQLTPVAAARGR